MDEDRGPDLYVDHLLPGWVTYRRGMPGYLRVRVKISRTTDMGLAPEAVLVERTDGRAVTARDLRSAKLPPAWLLAAAGEQPYLTHPWEPSPASPLATARQGPRGKGEDHWRAVLSLWDQAQRDAPRAPVRWMRERWPGDVSDATMRRWIKRARERAGTDDQGEDADDQALPELLVSGTGRARPRRQDAAGQAARQELRQAQDR